MSFAEYHEHDFAVSEIMWCVHTLVGVLLPDAWLQEKWAKPPSPYGADHGRTNWIFIRRCKALQVATDAMFDKAVKSDTALRKDVKLVCSLLSIVSSRMMATRKGDDTSYRAFISLFDRASFAALLLLNVIHTEELRLVLQAVSDGMLYNRANLEMALSDSLLDGSIVRVLSNLGENLMKIPAKIQEKHTRIQSIAVKECLIMVGEALCPPPQDINKVVVVKDNVNHDALNIHPMESHEPEPSNYDIVEPYGARRRKLRNTPRTTGVDSKEQVGLPAAVTSFEHRLQDMNDFINEAKDSVRTNDSYAGSIAEFEFAVLCEILLQFSTNLCNVRLRDRKAGAKFMQILMKIKFTADVASEKRIGPFYTVFNAISRSMQGMGRALEIANTPEKLNTTILNVLETLASNMLLVCELPMQALNPDCEETMYAAIYSLNPFAA
jgi:hypothetical protein